MAETRVPLSYFLDFYVLEVMCALSNPQFSRAKERLEEDVRLYHNWLVGVLAPATFDYLFASILGEARHTRDNVKDIYLNLPPGGTRESVYRHAHLFDPKQALPVLIKEVYARKWSNGGYGGAAWQNVAQAAMLYFTLPGGAFIDHVVDLQHNSGMVFNKPYLFYHNLDGARFKAFLDYKSVVAMLPLDLWRAQYTPDARERLSTPGHGLKCPCPQCQYMGSTRFYANLSNKVARLLARFVRLYHPSEPEQNLQPILSTYPQKSCLTYPDTYIPITYGRARLEVGNKHPAAYVYKPEADKPAFCSMCGNSLDTRRAKEVDGLYYCDECRYRYLYFCPACLSSHLKKRSILIEGVRWCEAYALKNARECSECGKAFHKENVNLIHLAQTGAYLGDVTVAHLCGRCMGRYKYCPTCLSHTNEHPAPWLVEGAQTWDSVCAICNSIKTRRPLVAAQLVEELASLDW